MILVNKQSTDEILARYKKPSKDEFVKGLKDLTRVKNDSRLQAELVYRYLSELKHCHFELKQAQDHLIHSGFQKDETQIIKELQRIWAIHEVKMLRLTRRMLKFVLRIGILGKYIVKIPVNNGKLDIEGRLVKKGLFSLQMPWQAAYSSSQIKGFLSTISNRLFGSKICLGKNISPAVDDLCRRADIFGLVQLFISYFHNGWSMRMHNRSAEDCIRLSDPKRFSIDPAKLFRKMIALLWSKHHARLARELATVKKEEWISIQNTYLDFNQRFREIMQSITLSQRSGMEWEDTDTSSHDLSLKPKLEEEFDQFNSNPLIKEFAIQSVDPFVICFVTAPLDNHGQLLLLMNLNNGIVAAVQPENFEPDPLISITDKLFHIGPDDWKVIAKLIGRYELNRALGFVVERLNEEE